MTRKRSMIAALIAGLVAWGCRPAPTADPASPQSPALSAPPAVAKTPEPAPAEGRVDPLADLDARVKRVMDAYAVPGLSLAIVKDGEVVVAKGYGVRERGKPEPVDADTSFAIASNTKAFVGTTLALLDHEKALDLDDRVAERLPWFRSWNACTTGEMRVRDLVTHRSGLDTWAGDLMWIGSTIDTRTLLSRLRHLPAVGLREKYGYSNLMFVVAGEVIAATTGKPWDAVVKARLLDPIGMTRTTTSLAALAEIDNVATPHAKHGEVDQVDAYLSMDNAGAAGSLNSTAADMGRWLLVQLDGGRIDGKEIVPPAVLAATRVPHTPMPVAENDPLGRHFQSYGLGWVLHDYRGRGVVTHSGGLPGMTSRVMMVPQERVGVVVLTSSESPASFLVAIDVVDAYLGGPTQDHLAIVQERTRAQAQAKAERPAKADGGSVQEPLAPASIRGTYRNPLLGRAIVEPSAEDAGVMQLRLPDHGGLQCPLRGASGGAFTCAWKNAIFGESDVYFDTQPRAGARRPPRATGLRFRVRPEFVDPLEYAFERAR
jgi:CubicO group peptidase (beta-lactamase class C family)